MKMTLSTLTVVVALGLLSACTQRETERTAPNNAATPSESGTVSGSGTISSSPSPDTSSGTTSADTSATPPIAASAASR